MIAYVTSIHERTEHLCYWQLKKAGFEVIMVSGNKTSLADKLKEIYNSENDDFIRVDADVVPNKNLTIENIKYYTSRMMGTELWWLQFKTFDWYKQDTTHGGVQLIKREALPALRKNIDKFLDAERPESQMFRLKEFHEPRRCISFNQIMGLHGYKQYGPIESIKLQKERRGQLDNYDFDLVEKLEQL